MTLTIETLQILVTILTEKVEYLKDVADQLWEEKKDLKKQIEGLAADLMNEENTVENYQAENIRLVSDVSSLESALAETNSQLSKLTTEHTIYRNAHPVPQIDRDTMCNVLITTVPGLMKQVHDFHAEGKKILAIKALREAGPAYGWPIGLKDAKHFIDKLWAEFDHEQDSDTPF